MALFSIIQEVDIEEKIKNAPDGNYEIGVFIGSILPFLILVIIAYAIYAHRRKRINKE